MADEYFEKYERLSHAELYRMLLAGSPRQVAATADTWGSMADTLSALAATLTQDLGRLGRSWRGHASREFAMRIALIAEFASDLAQEAARMRTGLEAMSNALRQAQRQAEAPPTQTLDNDELPSAAGTGLGWVSPQEAKRAHERMAWLVAKLAAEYGVVAHGTWPSAISEPPRGTPGLDTIVDIARGHHDHHHRRRRPLGTVLAGAEYTGTPVAPAPIAVPSAPVPAQPHEWKSAVPTELAAQTRAGAAPGGTTNNGNTSSANNNAPAGISTGGMPVAPVGMASPLASAPGQFQADTSPAQGHLDWQRTELAEWSDHDSDAPPSVLGDG